MMLKREDAETLALQAFVFIVADEVLRDRFVALSGIMPEEIKSEIANTSFLVAVLSFLVDHEPDLMKTAQAIGQPPECLVAAWHVLGGGSEWP